MPQNDYDAFRDAVRTAFPGTEITSYYDQSTNYAQTPTHKSDVPFGRITQDINGYTVELLSPRRAACASTLVEALDLARAKDLKVQELEDAEAKVVAIEKEYGLKARELQEVAERLYRARGRLDVLGWNASLDK